MLVNFLFAPLNIVSAHFFRKTHIDHKIIFELVSYCSLLFIFTKVSISNLFLIRIIIVLMSTGSFYSERTHYRRLHSIFIQNINHRVSHSCWELGAFTGVLRPPRSDIFVVLLLDWDRPNNDVH